MSVQTEEIVELFESLNEDEKESTYNYLQFLCSLRNEDKEIAATGD
ncbi:MAG: hypothetical protein ABF868_11360 [Sporolactobacillus sp.]